MSMAGRHHDAAGQGRVLALDFGSVRTGVAISDPSRAVAEPLEPVLKAASSEGMNSIGTIVGNYAVQLVVVGLPVGLRGETQQTARTRSFADRLRRVLTVPVELHDERFTSRMADRSRAATGSETSRDSLAACHLLTSWMEERNR